MGLAFAEVHHYGEAFAEVSARMLCCCATFHPLTFHHFINQLCSHCRSPALRKRQQSRGLRSVAGDAQSSAASSAIGEKP